MTSAPAIDVRNDFPALDVPARGRRLVYLDNAATTLKPTPVVDAITRYYREYSANIHRGVYEMSERASTAFEEARSTMARFIGAEGGHVIFTMGTTDAINVVARSWGEHQVGSGDEIVLSPIEHHANLVPWQQIAERTGATLRFLPTTDGGTLIEEEIEGAIGERCRLVAVTAMSNVTGYRPPIERIVAAAHRVGARVLIDGAQYATHAPVSVASLGCDFFVFSGHKMCGPTGIGVLWVNDGAVAEMQPSQFGGAMIERVTLNGATWAHVPERFEAGTPHIAGAIGIAAAADYLSAIGMDRIEAHERELAEQLRDGLSEMGWVTVLGDAPAERRAGIVSFVLDGAHPHDVGSMLDQLGVAVRTGLHCAQPLIDRFGTPGTVRASFYLYNTPDDVQALLHGLVRVHAILG